MGLVPLTCTVIKGRATSRPCKTSRRKRQSWPESSMLRCWVEDGSRVRARHGLCSRPGHTQGLSAPLFERYKKANGKAGAGSTAEDKLYRTDTSSGRERVTALLEKRMALSRVCRLVVLKVESQDQLFHRLCSIQQPQATSSLLNQTLGGVGTTEGLQHV